MGKYDELLEEFRSWKEYINLSLRSKSERLNDLEKQIAELKSEQDRMIDVIERLSIKTIIHCENVDDTLAELRKDITGPQKNRLEPKDELVDFTDFPEIRYKGMCIECAKTGDYFNKSLYLDCDYKWELVSDKIGQQFIIACKK